MTTLHLRKSIGRPSLRHGFLLIPFAIALAWFALSPTARAVSPVPDGGYPGYNTAEGTQALLSLTTGIHNTALGGGALRFDTTGSRNTATGSSTLVFNNGDYNTATGFRALYSNTAGVFNTANGGDALTHNTIGLGNTAIGSQTLYSNNTTTGGPLRSNNNTAVGWQALYRNDTGSLNIALGAFAGFSLTTGDNNIDIGNPGVAAEANTIRIGIQGTQTATFIAGISGVTLPNGVGVVIDTTSGQLGIAPSSQRFKAEIKPMDKSSEAILSLKPVTFHYKKEIDPKGIPQFGLVAEDVEKVNPALVTRDAQGKPYTVRYEAVNAMLLNEFLKEHRKAQEQEATIAQQQKEIKALTASLKEQASQIQKVSAQLEVGKPAAQMAVNDR